jgi:hypothetical protein
VTTTSGCSRQSKVACRITRCAIPCFPRRLYATLLCEQTAFATCNGIWCGAALDRERFLSWITRLTVRSRAMASSEPCPSFGFSTYTASLAPECSALGCRTGPTFSRTSLTLPLCHWKMHSLKLSLSTSLTFGCACCEGFASGEAWIPSETVLHSVGGTVHLRRRVSRCSNG